ncbi:MAG: hypothetical protein AAGA85_12695, partial [Bacteroidota bacterium]
EASFTWYLRFVQQIDAVRLPQLNRIAFSCLDWSCEAVALLWEQRSRADLDANTTNTLLTLALDNGCIKKEFFEELAWQVIRTEQNIKLVQLIAGKLAADGQRQLAADIYNYGLEFTQDESTLLEILIKQAVLHQVRGDYPNARRFARKILAQHPGHELAHELIGDLYFDSYYNCKKGISRVEDRAIFIAAYRQYELAGAAEKMNLAKEQFPSGQEIFEDLFSVNEVFTVGCWVNESVRLDKRD